MKNFHIPASHLTPTLADAINLNEEGIYVVYGVFIYNQALSINKLHKGQFSEIQVQQHTDENGDFTNYLVPVPEFIANERDAEYAKYIQIHFIKQEDIKSDEEMMQEFVKAFASKLANVEGEQAQESSAVEVKEENNGTEPS